MGKVSTAIKVGQKLARALSKTAKSDAYLTNALTHTPKASELTVFDRTGATGTITPGSRKFNNPLVKLRDWADYWEKEAAMRPFKDLFYNSSFLGRSVYDYTKKLDTAPTLWNMIKRINIFDTGKLSADKIIERNTNKILNTMLPYNRGRLYNKNFDEEAKEELFRNIEEGIRAFILDNINSDGDTVKKFLQGVKDDVPAITQESLIRLKKGDLYKIVNKYRIYDNYYKSNIYEVDGKLLISTGDNAINFDIPTGNVEMLDFGNNELHDFYVQPITSTGGAFYDLSGKLYDINATEIIDTHSLFGDRKGNEDIAKITQRNNEFVNKLIGGKAFGSSVYALLGDNLQFVAHDYDRIFTQKQVQKLAKDIPRFDSILQAIKNGDKGLAYKIDLSTIPGSGLNGANPNFTSSDINVIMQDSNGHAVGPLAEEIYRQFWPDQYNKNFLKAWLKANEKYYNRAIKNGNWGDHQEFNNLNIEIRDENGRWLTPEDLYEGFDPLEKSIIDLFESGKDKQVRRSLAIMSLAEPQKFANALHKYATSIYGSSYQAPPNFINQFTDPEENLKLLQDMNYPTELANYIKDKPQAIQNFLEYWYLSNTGSFRIINQSSHYSKTGKDTPDLLDINALNQSALWWVNVNGAYSGPFLNNAAGGHSGWGSLSTHDNNGIMQIIQIPLSYKPGVTPSQFINDVKRATGHPSYRYTKEELGRIADVVPINMKKNVYNIESPDDLGDFLSTLSANDVHKVSAALKQMGIYAYTRKSHQGFGQFRGMVDESVDPSLITWRHPSLLYNSLISRLESINLSDNSRNRAITPLIDDLLSLKRDLFVGPQQEYDINYLLTHGSPHNDIDPKQINRLRRIIGLYRHSNKDRLFENYFKNTQAEATYEELFGEDSVNRIGMSPSQIAQNALYYSLAPILYPAAFAYHHPIAGTILAAGLGAMGYMAYDAFSPSRQEKRDQQMRQIAKEREQHREYQKFLNDNPAVRQYIIDNAPRYTVPTYDWNSDQPMNDDFDNYISNE